jgi:hypothetical protein
MTQGCFFLIHMAPVDKPYKSAFTSRPSPLQPRCMNLDSARRIITKALVSADDLLGRTAFNEWMLVSLVGLERQVLYYAGPRPETAQEQFADDLRPLARELIDHRHRIGKVDFVPDGDGPAFDVLITLGAGLFAILNDTSGTTTDLRREAAWREAEARIIQLGDCFVHEPLAL